MQHLGDRTPGLSAWAAAMPALLPEHVWIAGEDSTATADLEVLTLGGGRLDPIPAEPALVIPSSLDAYHAWESAGREALAFLCLSNDTARVIRSQQVAPCRTLSWEVWMLDQPDASPLNAGNLMTESKVLPSPVWFFLPSGDAPSARTIASWLMHPECSSEVPVTVVGPLSPDAEHLLRRAGTRARLRIVNQPEDEQVLTGIDGAQAAIVIDLAPSAEMTAYLGPIVRRECPTLVIADGAYADLGTVESVTLLPAAMGADAAASSIRSFMAQQARPRRGIHDSIVDARLAREALAASIGGVIDLAVSFRPAQEAIRSLRSSMQDRGLLGPVTATAAAHSLAWMLHEQPWFHYDHGA